MSTKQAIIQAAARLFAENGYEGMTMKLIADEVGITPPAVYVFFKNKEDLFLHIYKEVLSGHLDIALYYSREFQSQPIRDQLYQLLRQLFDYHIRDQLQIKIFLRLLLFPPAVFQKNLREDVSRLEEAEAQLFADIFERGIRQGELRIGDSRQYAKAMLLLMDGLFWRLQRGDEAVFWEEFEQGWEHFWQGIEPRETGET